LSSWKEEGTAQDPTTYLIVGEANDLAAVPLNASNHFVQSCSSVLLLKRFPRQVNGDSRVADDETPANDRAPFFGMKFEEEWSARGQTDWGSTGAWLPEIDLIQIWARGEESVPVVVGNADPVAHSGHRGRMEGS
jgi:hypothetical protein